MGNDRVIAGIMPAKVLAAVVVLGAIISYVYYPILQHLVSDWSNDPNSSHGFLIPALSLYFIWERKDQLAAILPTPNLWGLGMLVGGLGLLYVGTIGAELFVMRMSLIIVIAGLILFLAGKDVMKILVFPIGFLIFMIPLPAIVLNAVSFPLQMFAAKTASFCLVNLDVPVLREGNVIMLAHTNLEVAEACSGLRSLMSLLALGFVFAYFSQKETWKRVVLVASCIPIAIAANAFRVSGTGVLAHLYGEAAAQGFYHTFSGWSVFVVAFVMLLAEGFVLSKIGRRAVVTSS